MTRKHLTGFIRCVLASSLLGTVLTEEVDASGNETAPEMVDALADVSYSTGNTQSRSHDFVDIWAGWLSYSNETDNVSIVARAVSNENLTAASRDWSIQCTLELDLMIQDETKGVVELLWAIRAPSMPVFETARFYPSGIAEPKPMPHGFTLNLTRPGDATWQIPRREFILLGSELANLRGLCSEGYDPGGVPLGALSAYDEAKSRSSYSVETLRRTRGPQGEPDELGATTTRPGDETTPTDDGRSPAPGPLILMAAIIASLAIRNRARR